MALAGHPAAPLFPPFPRVPFSVTPARPFLRHTRASPFPSYPRLPRVSRRVQHPSPLPPPPLFPRHSRPREGISPRNLGGTGTHPTPAPRFRRPKLDLEPAPGLNRGPIRRWSAARRTGMPCECALAGHSDPRAANGVGFGPQIKFGATEKGVRRGLGVVRGAGAALGEIPAASAGMTEVGARYDGGAYRYDGGERTGEREREVKAHRERLVCRRRLSGAGECEWRQR